MSLLLEPVVGCSATDLDGVLPSQVDKDSPSGFLGRTGCLGDQEGLVGAGEGGRREESGFLSGLSGMRCKVGGSDGASSESSSIGVPDDSDEEETGSGDEDEVQSTLSLGSLEDSLPIKRGLSNYYTGRSKSFGNLADVKTVKDMEKPDNPLNKRRRTFLAYKLSSWSASSSSSSSPSKRRMMMIKDNNRASFYGHRNPISMPLLPVHEHDDDDDDDDEDNDNDNGDKDDDGDNETDHKRGELQLGLSRQSRFCI